MQDMLDQSLMTLAKRLKTKAISPVEITRACLQRIERTEPQLNAYVTVLAEQALSTARQAESEIMAGCWKGPLHGVPIALKDLYDMQGVATTASSRQRRHWIAEADGEVTRRLKAAGAVIVGKTQTHEFAFGITTPTTRNPWDDQRTPGGSSGGSAATLASGGAFMAMGTDTGGSIRIPSSLCGTVGLKPTYGRISRRGITPLSWGLDHAGPLTRDVADAAACLQLLAGHDPADPGSAKEAVPDFSARLGQSVAGMTIGVPSNYFFDRVDPEVAEATRAVHRQLEALGAELVEVTTPMPEPIGMVQKTIVMAEASTYHRNMLGNSPELYTDQVRTLLEAGALIPATDYIQALRVRTRIQQAFAALFDAVDVIIAPSVATTAEPAGTSEVSWNDGISEPIHLAYTRLATPGNVTGLPAMNIPCGLTGNGLPIGCQIMGPPMDEATVLQVGAAWQQVSDWHQRRPPMTAESNRHNPHAPSEST